MSGTRYFCFNNTSEKESECIYNQNCPLFNVEIDGCIAEQLKGKTPTSTTQTTIRSTQAQQPLKPTGEGILSKINVGSFVPEITGTIITAPEFKEVKGPTTLAEFMITDGYENAKVTVWAPLDEAIKGYKNGDTITIKNLGSKEYNGQLQLGTTRKSTIPSQ